ncbi:MAG TPA: DinB family protein [Thermoanaerobaculia bacterium]|nr:DinB family protein [Thermoanaerobaculia bacterium]
MSTRDYFIQRFNTERPAFVKVIRALPSEKLDYKPHERNSSAGDIAWFLAQELGALVQMLETGEIQWKQVPTPDSLDEIADAYEAAADKMEKALSSADDARWEQEGKMYFGGKLMKTAPIGETLWDFWFDAIHHRGQLTAYLRPMGGTVPSVYGPTADEKG